jgi:hypothetical protein
MARTQGAKTSKLKWNVKVMVNDNELFNQDFSSLNQVAEPLGLSYFQVVEMANGRKKCFGNGKYDTRYIFSKI